MWTLRCWLSGIQEEEKKLRIAIPLQKKHKVRALVLFKVQDLLSSTAASTAVCASQRMQKKIKGMSRELRNTLMHIWTWPLAKRKGNEIKSKQW